MFQQIEEALDHIGADRGNAESFASLADRITRQQVRAMAAIASGMSNDDEGSVSKSSSTLR